MTSAPATFAKFLLGAYESRGNLRPGDRAQRRRTPGAFDRGRPRGGGGRGTVPQVGRRLAADSWSYSLTQGEFNEPR